MAVFGDNWNSRGPDNPGREPIRAEFFVPDIDPSGANEGNDAFLITNKTLFYTHSKGYTNCVLTFEYYSMAVNHEDEQKGYRCETHLKIESKNNTKMHESWYRNDDIDLTAATKNLTLTEEGMYKVKIQNMDEIDFVTAFITGFNNCTNNKKYMNSSEFAEIHYSAERTINDLFLNLGKVVTEEGMVDKKKAMIKNTHSKLLYGTVGEILAIIIIAWWQVFYLISLLEKKLVV